ncbi:Neural-cadherin Cadherin-N [Channa argus]|uniref:Neural-cadherin Cadherin-N n=1 Tax=Channa argus TaxID=215402 RepID=A0A6G1PQG7_CHAAH|nr:Neural-cadherin Cadherin-N [Channa argus]
MSPISSAASEEWYLCRLTLSMASQADLQWMMFPVPYLSAVGPDAAPDSVVYRLSARPRDGMQGQAQFILLDGGEEGFEVNRRSGEIRTTGRPLTPSKEYLLRVQAIDARGRKSLPATVAVLAGYRPPQFTNSTYSLNVPENTPVGQPTKPLRRSERARFHGIGEMPGRRSDHAQCFRGSGRLLPEEESVLHAAGESWEPVQHQPGERGAQPHQGRRLRERTQPAQSAGASLRKRHWPQWRGRVRRPLQVTVHITDENDCTPEFFHSIYTRDNIPESVAPGTSLLQVLARDCDSGLNSEILYFVHGDDFDISSGGVIFPARRLDYERPNHIYEFVVVAVDAGMPPRTGTASVRIRVTNSNDEAPVFSQSVYKTFLSEDAGPDTLVAIVHANDPDGDAVSYAITGGNEDSNFLLDNQKGIIKLRRSPAPRLRGPQYVLNITVTDDNASGGPYPLSSSAQVIVGINDINNNKPVFQDCQNYSLNAAVLENQPPGTFVLRVQAHDADMGVNGEIKYGIMHRDGVSSGFDIDPNTGGFHADMSVSLVNTQETLKGFVSPFVRCDHHGEEFRPRASEGVHAFGDGHRSGRGAAHRDLSDHGSHRRPERQRPQRCAVLCSVRFNDARTQTPEMILRAAGSGWMQGQRHVMRHCGRFELKCDTNETNGVDFLREDTPVGTSFLRAAAHDDDQGSNAAIIYSLSNQKPAYLHINPSTGWIYVNHPISQTSRINQQIVASDGGNRSSSVELSVIITNVHNQPPQWEQAEYWVTVPENTVRDAKIVVSERTREDKTDWVASHKVAQSIFDMSVAKFNDAKDEDATFKTKLNPDAVKETTTLRSIIHQRDHDSSRKTANVEQKQQNSQCTRGTFRASILDDIQFEEDICRKRDEYLRPVFLLQQGRVMEECRMESEKMRREGVRSVKVKETWLEFVMKVVKSEIPVPTTCGKQIKQDSHDNTTGFKEPFTEKVPHTSGFERHLPLIKLLSANCCVAFAADRTMCFPAAESAAMSPQAIICVGEGAIGLRGFWCLKWLTAFLTQRFSVSLRGNMTIKATSPLGDPRVTYNLEEGQMPETNMPVRFYIKPNRADSSASILVAENLDYETTRSFMLRVRVQNVAAVPLASFTTVYINVTATTTITINLEKLQIFFVAAYRVLVSLSSDVNDNVPFFLSSTYEATVPEGAEIGTSVAQVSATDLDSGPHGMIHYVILKDESGDSQLFSIDPHSGVIATRASFDREQKASYLIEVQSQDDTAYVRIFITDVNDNAPAFAQLVYEVSVEEDKEVGFVLITVTANDEDEGANAKLRYQITAGNTMGTFDVEPEVGTIFVAQPLDYEMEQRYELRLVASDGKWENETLVVVQVLNRNDEAPIFSQTEYHAVVTEELTQLPVFILEVLATDPDQEADQTALRYSLHGQGAGGEFTIDERTGRIYAQRRLDREERPAWRFLILATDEGGTGLTGFADVLLEVRDVNDNAPFFPCPALEVDGCFVGKVPENSPADTSVMEMRAMDLDDPNEGTNAMMTYSIIKNVRNEINLNLFSINASTGTIYTVLRSLDRETEDQYLVVVEARDGGGLAGTGTATIMVSDVNDHPPIFTHKVYTTQVTEDLEVNSEVLVVSATDGDEGENAVVTFSIVGGDEDRKFFVDTDKLNRRGVIKLKKKVDFEKPQERTFNLTLKAEDADFFSLAYCLIHVEDSNDHAPIFFPQFYESPAMSEDIPVGTIVAQVTASDLDSGQNGHFSYSISRDSDPYSQFLVDQSGWVVVADSLDREKISQHRIMVLATDAGSPPLTGTAIVVVSVLDVNDNGPEFEVPYKPVVWENTAAPQAVLMNETSFLVHATDRDTSSNGGPFSIRLLMLTSDATNFNLTDFRNGSAAITALRTFDRERQKEYRLPILMIDSGSPPMSSTSTLTVVIGDRNDHPHSPGHSDFIVYSYEGILPTTVLGRIQSPDLDDWSEKVYRFEGKPSSPSTQIWVARNKEWSCADTDVMFTVMKYMEVAGIAWFFNLNKSSGQLSIREGTPLGSYHLQVRVSDPTWPDVTSTAQVVVMELQQDALQNAASIRLSNLTVEAFFSSSGGEESPFSRLGRTLAELLQTLPENILIFSVSNTGRPGEKEFGVWFAAHGSPYYKAEKLHGYVAANKAKLEAMLGVSISQVGVDDCPHTDCSQSGGCSNEVSFSQAPVALSFSNTTLVSLAASSMARCKCPPMFDGPECQQTKHSFGGQGYAWFPPLRPCFQSHVSLEFLAESANGLLLYNGPLDPINSREQEDFIAVELINGVPALSINHGSGTLTLQLPLKSTVTDRRWHRLDIISDGKAVQMILDLCGGLAVNEQEGVGGDTQEVDESSCRVEGETPGNQRYLNVFQPLQLGGIKETSSTHRYRSFVGCIRNLVVDTQVYDLAFPGESVDSSPGCRLTDGVCVTADSPSCGAHASCLADWGSFSCECLPGYTGHKCDKGSAVRYQLRGGGSSRRTNIQLLLRTRSASGTLVSVTSREASEYIVLEIMEGHLSVRANLGDGAHALRLTGQRVDIGQWVLVSLTRHDNLFTLRLEQGGGSREAEARLGNRREIVVHPASVMIGNGLKSGDKTDFQGCLRDVRFNGQLLPLDGQSRDLVMVLEKRGVTSGCYSDACSGQPCRSPLRCIDLWRKHQCRCPSGQVMVTDDSGQQRCVPSPCGPSSCRNGGNCQALSPDSYRCRCQEGFRGQRCELGRLKGHRLAALSPSSILAISMCLLVFFGKRLMKGSRNKFRKRGVYHIPAEHESWEDIRENILNYNEEGGGEQDQNGYDITELKRPLCSSLSQSSSCTTAPLIKSSPGSQEEVHPSSSSCSSGAPYLSIPHPHHHHNSDSTYTNYTTPVGRDTEAGDVCSYVESTQAASRSHVDFKSYVARIIWEADNDSEVFPPDAYHVWCVEGSGSSAGSLSSLGSAASRPNITNGLGDEEEGDGGGFVHDRLSRWGPKFQALSEMYDRPQLALTYRDAMAYIQRSHSHDPLPQNH